MYLLDTNVLIRAHEDYYPLDAIPEYWSWLIHMGSTGNIKIPREIFDEVNKGPKDDPLAKWISLPDTKAALILQEAPDGGAVQHVLSFGYGLNLTETELEKIGMDPFLVAYAASSAGRTVVTCEVSAPSKQRANRKVPDVCAAVNVPCCTQFQFTKRLGFKTNWQSAGPAIYPVPMPSQPHTVA